MSYETIHVQRARHFVPNEAQAISAELRNIASEARDLGTRLWTLGGDLDSTWEGRARTRFLDNFSNEPSDCESCAIWLEDQASQVGAITVTEWEAVLETVWVPYT
ncbi:MAG: WXG100 family type VII secretion target [Anaerolineales bacterium]